METMSQETCFPKLETLSLRLPWLCPEQDRLELWDLILRATENNPVHTLYSFSARAAPCGTASAKREEEDCEAWAELAKAKPPAGAGSVELDWTGLFPVFHLPRSMSYFDRTCRTLGVARMGRVLYRPTASLL